MREYRVPIDYLEQIIGGWTLTRILHERSSDKLVELLRPLGRLIEFWWIGFLYFQQNPHRRHLVIRRFHLSKFN